MLILCTDGWINGLTLPITLIQYGLGACQVWHEMLFCVFVRRQMFLNFVMLYFVL